MCLLIFVMELPTCELKVQDPLTQIGHGEDQTESTDAPKTRCSRLWVHWKIVLGSVQVVHTEKCKACLSGRNGRR